MIVKLMAVFFLRNKSASILVNLREFVYNPGVFEALFLNMGDELVSDKGYDQEIEEINVPNNRGGQLFPEIINVVAEFVKQHGFAAQSRRRNETVYCLFLEILDIYLTGNREGHALRAV